MTLTRAPGWAAHARRPGTDAQPGQQTVPAASILAVLETGAAVLRPPRREQSHPADCQRAATLPDSPLRHAASPSRVGGGGRKSPVTSCCKAVNLSSLMNSFHFERATEARSGLASAGRLSLTCHGSSGPRRARPSAFIVYCGNTRTT